MPSSDNNVGCFGVQIHGFRCSRSMQRGTPPQICSKNADTRCLPYIQRIRCKVWVARRITIVPIILTPAGRTNRLRCIIVSTAAKKRNTSLLFFFGPIGHNGCYVTHIVLNGKIKCRKLDALASTGCRLLCVCEITFPSRTDSWQRKPE